MPVGREGAATMHPSQELSRAVWYGVHDSLHCGYCKRTRPGHRVSAGMVAQKLTVYAYQELLDVGWRRSGTYVYHADPKGTCCPAYTIRLDATQFTPTTAQRRVLRRFESFCCGDWARRQRTRQSHGHDAAPASPRLPDAAPDTGMHHAEADSKEDHATRPGDMLAVHKRVADRCSQAVARHMQSCAAPAVAAALATADCVFTVKKPPAATAEMEVEQSATYMLCLHSALCWKAAAQAARAAAPAVPPPPAQGARPQPSQALSPTPPLSKNKAKKARKAAMRAAAAAGAASGPPVAALATELAAAALPAVRDALASDAAVAALAPSASAERGHLRITLQLPGAVPPGATPEVRALLQPLAAAAGSTAALPRPAALGGPRADSEARGGATAEPHSGTANASGSEQSDESLGSDAEWSPESSEAASEAAADAAGAEYPKWWLADPPDGGWKLHMVLRPSEFVEEEYQLYQRYQCTVHGDSPDKSSRKGFQRFLVDTPWQGTVPPTQDADAPECGYGAFHMQYWLGDRLIAVGVWDILPRCLSSKYFIWDPDLSFLSLGKLSALKEVEWVRAAHAAGAATLRYAYFGLYIHSNQKMRYKAEYQPSDLLCPSTLAWVPCSGRLLRALDDHDGTSDLSALEQPRAAAMPAIPLCAQGRGPYDGMPGLPPLQEKGAFAADDVLVLVQGSLVRMRHWLDGVVSARAVRQLRRLAEEVLAHMGPRAASQICMVFD